MSDNYIWTDNPTVSGVSKCDTDILNDCLMHLKYHNTSNGRELFDVVFKDKALSYEESQGWALLGTYVYKNALLGTRYGYPDFYERCIDEKNSAEAVEITLGDNVITIYMNKNGHQFYDISDKDIVDEFYNQNGVAWFYGVDVLEQRIFLPRNDYYFKNGSFGEIGQFVAPGIPNIKGSFSRAFADDTLNCDGVFYVPSTTGTARYGTQTRGSVTNSVGFDASLSNSVYGNSSSVQPPSVNVLAYMVVGNVNTNQGYSEIVAEGTNILNQLGEGLSLKLDADFSNFTKPYVIETYINSKSGYRLWSDGYCEQWGCYSFSGTHGSKYNISLLLSLSNDDYLVLRGGTFAIGTTSGIFVSVVEKAVDSFAIQYCSQTGGAYPLDYYWKVCGYKN